TIHPKCVHIIYAQNASAPTTVSYNIGRFGPGYLRTTTRLETLRTGPRGTLTLEGDNTNQTTDCFGACDPAFDSGAKVVQWLERASVAYPLSPQSSVAIGVRCTVGTS